MFSIYDILNEADDDESTEAAPAGGDDAGDADEDEDLNIDTSLDVDTSDTDDAVDDTGEGDSGGEDYEGGGDTTSSSSGGSSNSGGGIDTDSDAEPVKANTDLFATLSAEEQAIKIGELKNLYRDLYTRIDDILHRIDELDCDEYTLEVITKISQTLHKLKQSVSDYFDRLFDIRSYYDNDFKFNEFLMYLNSATSIVDDLAKSRDRRLGRETDNSK